MSGRQQRVMVQPIVRTVLPIDFSQLMNPILECYLQKLATGQILQFLHHVHH